VLGSVVVAIYNVTIFFINYVISYAFNFQKGAYYKIPKCFFSLSNSCKPYSIFL